MLKKICAICLAAVIVFSGIMFTNNFTNTATAAETTTSVDQVTNLTKEYKGTTVIKLTWDKVSDAAGYEVYYKRSGATEWTLYKRTSANSLTLNNTLALGRKYYFKVRAYKTSGSSRICGACSDNISVTAGTPAKVSLNSITRTGSATVTLKWDTQSGVTGYRVYRKASGGSWSRIKIITSSSTGSYTDTNVKSGTLYYYKVRAYRNYGTSYLYGEYSNVKSITGLKLTAPASVKATSASATSIKISWSKGSNNNLTGYQVYRKTKSSDSWTRVKTTTSTSYTDEGLTTGTKYYYKVRAYKKGDVYTYYSSCSSNVSATAGTPAKVTGLSLTTSTSTGYMNVSWTKQSGVTGYRVYRKATTGSWKRIAIIKGSSTTSYKDTGTSSGKRYYYKVRAYNTINGKNYYGEYSTTKSHIAVKIVSVSGFSVQRTGKEKVCIKWTRPSNTYNWTYKIYRKCGSTGSWKTLAYVSSGKTPYYDDTVTEGKTYYYRIKAYCKANNKTYFSSYTSSKKVYLRTVSGYRYKFGTFKCGSYSGKMYIARNCNYYLRIVNDSNSILTYAPYEYGDVPTLTLCDHSNQVFRALWYVSVGDTCTITTSLGTTKLKCIKVNYRQKNWNCKSCGVTSNTIAMQTCEVGGGSTYGNRIVVWKVVSGPSVKKLNALATEITTSLY